MSGNPYDHYYVPLAGDQGQVPFDGDQRPSSTDFPRGTFEQGSFGANSYTMDLLPPANSAFHSMVPSISNWTGVSDDSTQNPYLGSSHGQGDYLPWRSQQQPVFDANSYPYYQDPSVYPYDDGQTMYSASQAFDSLTGTTHQTGPGQPFLGKSGAPPYSEDGRMENVFGRSLSGHSNRSSRTSTDPTNPLAPSGGGIPARKRKKPYPSNNAKVLGKVVELEYCTLGRLEKWLEKYEPFKKATAEELKDPKNRMALKRIRWDIFARWAAQDSGHQGKIERDVCNRCFESYGKFYPCRRHVEADACRCLPVNAARLAEESELPEPERLGFGNAKYFPKDRPQFLE